MPFGNQELFLVFPLKPLRRKAASAPFLASYWVTVLGCNLADRFHFLRTMRTTKQSDAVSQHLLHQAHRCSDHCGQRSVKQQPKGALPLSIFKQCVKHQKTPVFQLVLEAYSGIKKRAFLPLIYDESR